jgi:hypothetical protein
MEFPFTRGGFHHRLLKRHGDVCLVQRRNLLTDSVHWEVVRLQHESARVIWGRAYPAHLRYPGTEQWGTAGWTYTTLPEAERRFSALLEARAGMAELALGQSHRAPQAET